MDADDLYGLPLERFVAERGALAKSLRAEGRRDEAAAVAGLRKPSIAAWAVNQLVRTQHADAQELFDAGDELREAQANLLAGSGDGRALRAAGERQRAAIDTLVDAARGLLTTAGDDLSPAIVERVSDTLHAAALDTQARQQVRDGRLERELRHIGLGLGESPAVPPAAAKTQPRRQKPSTSGSPPAAGRAARRHDDGGAGARAKDDASQTAAHEDGDARAPVEQDASRPSETARERRMRESEERAAAERAERERAAARTAARAAEAKARRRAESAARVLADAEQRREHAERALREADVALATAREDAARALAEHEHAQADLEAARRDR
jgi:hypothetical protein